MLNELIIDIELIRNNVCLIKQCIQCVNRDIHAHEIKIDYIRTREDAANEIIRHNKQIDNVKRKLIYNPSVPPMQRKLIMEELESLRVKVM